MVQAGWGCAHSTNPITAPRCASQLVMVPTDDCTLCFAPQTVSSDCWTWEVEGGEGGNRGVRTCPYERRPQSQSLLLRIRYHCSPQRRSSSRGLLSPPPGAPIPPCRLQEGPESAPARAARARAVYDQAFRTLRDVSPDAKEEAVMLLEAWKAFEQEQEWRSVDGKGDGWEGTSSIWVCLLFMLRCFETAAPHIGYQGVGGTVESIFPTRHPRVFEI